MPNFIGRKGIITCGKFSVFRKVTNQINPNFKVILHNLLVFYNIFNNYKYHFYPTKHKIKPVVRVLF